MSGMDEITSLCIYVLACEKLDWEATIGGNGINAFEASPLAHKILKITGMTDEGIEEYTQNKADELKEEYK